MKKSMRIAFPATPFKPKGFIRARCFLLSLLLAACGPASACQRIIQITLTFADGSADLDRTQIIRLANWIANADAMFATYMSAGVEAGATAKPPERTPRQAGQLARMRADTVALALERLFPAPLEVEKFSYAYREAKELDARVVNDFAAIQLYPDLSTSKLPGCNPGLPDGLER